MQLRTQIYLEPGQHAALIKESRKLGLSLAGMIRKLVEDHVLSTGRGKPGEDDRKKATLSLMSLGESGLSDVSGKVDEHLGRAIYEDRVRDRRRPYRSRKAK